ncbi:thiol-disulfide oxidoreductase DCC family protein [Halpernia sp.]|uniref:thiol-disulfide oxidoreductase DCC family protein n=1 Tax=Halpernia sp. TaxID=2782209 RepID=UPI003A8EC1ED
MNIENKYVVFYDGDCGFCNFWVGWILKNDKKNQFLFSALQSEFGQKFLSERNLNTDQFNTLYLFSPGKFYLMKSSAVLKIANILGGKFSFLRIFKIIPKFLSDYVYDFISRNRMKMASAKCYLPTAEERKKFIEKI